MEKLYTTVKRNRKDTVSLYIKRLYSPYLCAASYSDKKCTDVTCGPNRNRSLDEIYQMCLAKFPKLTKDSFFKAIIEVLETKTPSKNNPEIEFRTFALLFCNTANSWVLYKSPRYRESDLYLHNLVYDFLGCKNYPDKKGCKDFTAQDVVNVYEKYFM